MKWSDAHLRARMHPHARALNRRSPYLRTLQTLCQACYATHTAQRSMPSARKNQQSRSSAEPVDCSGWQSHGGVWTRNMQVQTKFLWAMHIIRKRQARWVSGNDVRKQNQFHRQVVRSACLRPRYRVHLGPISVAVFKVASTSV